MKDINLCTRMLILSFLSHVHPPVSLSLSLPFLYPLIICPHFTPSASNLSLLLPPPPKSPEILPLVQHPPKYVP